MNTQEQAICTAPPGQLRIVHVDPRDHWPTLEKDVKDANAARDFLDTMDDFSREVMAVFDDKGERITV